jgi:EAL domain-containing protein (putative c-di-GMP-specific phosphodiesterase class I)
MDAATGFIGELKRLGCRCALDDFGGHLSSFPYLKNLPVDYLKTDGKFVKHMETDAIDCAMVSSFHHIGSVMGNITITEFVGNDRILRKLAQTGVDYAQGNGIARPRPLHEMQLLSKHSS